tara:strand:+ start:8524 stop:8934 length:411 start_codon:yes stop_codon:yes gene_type:complete
MSQSLKDKFDQILRQKGLTQKEVVSAIGIGMSTFAKWRSDPDGASNATLQKIREFTENPDKVLKGDGAPAKPAKRTKPKPINAAGFTMEMIEEMMALSHDQLGYVLKILHITGVESLTVNQIKDLAALHGDSTPSE